MNFLTFTKSKFLQAENHSTYDDKSIVSLCLKIVLWSTKTRITLKNLALFRPKVRDSYSTNQITRFVDYDCYGVNVMEFSIRLKN